MEKMRTQMRGDVRCSISANLCSIVRQTRHFMDVQFIIEACRFVSEMCGESGKEGCHEQGLKCWKAADALQEGDEKKYAELCEEAYESCPNVIASKEKRAKLLEERRRAMTRREPSSYIAKNRDPSGVI